MDKEQILKGELNSKINAFKDDSKEHKKLHRQLRYTAFIFTGILSILSGLALYFPDDAKTINIIILAISATSGVLASIEGLRKADELWIHERTTYYTLCDLKRELEFELHGNVDKEKTLDKYFDRFQKILTNSGEKWSSGIVKGMQNNEVKSD